ncbi:MAG TPA: hypothetical protein PKD26_13075 [Pyrinomonadaceae bacterium]|mgnify:CR=1 FL=1|nr:hypothetical protein [Pyrinomonadaceae bacterium]
MDKIYRKELRRKFLIDALPEPLTRASRHLQIFDNYIEGTRMRMRSVRDPESKEWSRLLQQRVPIETDGWLTLKVDELHLTESEHEVFSVFEGTEIRKNRYFHEFDRRPFLIDMYLGELWGVNIANVEFPDEASFIDYEPPPFAVFDITNDHFFLGEQLVHKKFQDVRNEVARISDRALIKVDTSE